MHPATKTNIAGQLAVIRQCLLGLEAAIAADVHQPAQKHGKSHDSAVSSVDTEMYTTEAEDDFIGEMMGLKEVEAETKKKKTGKAKEGVVNG